MLSPQDKKDIMNIVSEAIVTLVLPHIDELKEGQERLEDRQSRLEDRQSVLEKGQDRTQAVVDQIARVQEQEVNRADRNEARISQLEHSQASA